MPTETRPEDQTTIAAARSEASASSRRSLGRAISLVVVAALLVSAGFAAGWLLRGSDEDSATSYVVGDAVIAGDDLTDRQWEMVDVTKQYVAAFVAKDGDAVASFMVPDGYLAMPTLGNRIVRVSDGSLQEWVEGIGEIPNELQEPLAVDRHQVVLTGRVEDALDWMILIEFTDSGEVQIVSDTHWADLRPGP